MQQNSSATIKWLFVSEFTAKEAEGYQSANGEQPKHFTDDKLITGHD